MSASVRPSTPEIVLVDLARAVWGFRVELAAVALVWAAWWALSGLLGPLVAAAVVVAVAAAVVSTDAARGRLAAVLGAARARRQWCRAVGKVGVAAFAQHLPRVAHVAPVPAGHVLDVRVPPGARVVDLEAAGEAVAAVLRVRAVRVLREPADASRARVTVVRRDPLADAGPLPWPNAGAEALSLWEPVPVGVDEDGAVVSLALPERNVLLGGEPGAGKSAALSLLVATAALDASVKLWLLDGKLVELAAWAPCAERSVGVDVGQAIDVLRSLQAEMEARYRVLLASRRRKVAPGDGLALHVVVVDELAHYLAGPDRKQRGEFAEVLRDLVSRGRAAGVIVVGATQKPSADVIPTSLRDLFGFRWALRCSTPQASDTILGQGWASAGFSAAEIDAASRGVGYLLHEGGSPVRLRAYYLDDDDVGAMAARAEALRSAPRLRVVPA